MPQLSSNPISRPEKPPAETSSAAVSATVRLEAHLLNPSPARAPSPADSDLTTQRVILVVDDDSEMRQYLKRCLMEPGATGVKVVEAADGEAALACAQREKIDLIISDITLPHLDGLALWRALKADARLHGVPVLLITGEGMPPSLPAGPGEVLEKPFNAATLLARVERLMALPS